MGDANRDVVIALIAQLLQGIQAPASIDSTIALGTGAEAWSELLDVIGAFGWLSADDYEKLLRVALVGAE